MLHVHTRRYTFVQMQTCVCVCVRECVCVYIYIYMGSNLWIHLFGPYAQLVFKSLELFWLNRTRKGFNPIASAPRTPAHPPSRPSHPHFPPPPAPPRIAAQLRTARLEDIVENGDGGIGATHHRPQLSFFSVVLETGPCLQQEDSVLPKVRPSSIHVVIIIIHCNKLHTQAGGTWQFKTWCSMHVDAPC